MQVQQLPTKYIISGLVYSEILHTRQAGFGSVGYELLSLLGIVDNRAIKRESRIVGY